VAGWPLAPEGGDQIDAHHAVAMLGQIGHAAGRAASPARGHRRFRGKTSGGAPSKRLVDVSGGLGG